MQLIKHQRAIVAWIFISAATVYWTGCRAQSSATVDPPNVDSQAAAAEAMRLYDKDSNGHLNDAELAACPAISAARKQYDLDRDGQISQEEVATRIDRLYGRSVGLVRVDCSVTRQGRPLSGATVRFIPESFLGTALQTAVDTTDSNGNCFPSIPAAELPANLQGRKFMQPGIYRVEIDHPSVSSKNSKPLGAEIDPMIRDGTTLQFNL
jgi:hypothetical protein